MFGGQTGAPEKDKAYAVELEPGMPLREEQQVAMVVQHTVQHLEGKHFAGEEAKANLRKVYDALFDEFARQQAL